MNFYPPRETAFRFYGSLRVVKVVPLASTLTMLASPETGAIRISRGECRNIDGWCGAGVLPPLSPLAAFQDDAPIFGHTRPAGVHAVLLKQLGNARVGRIFATQFQDGVMEWFQIIERNAAWVGLKFLNHLVQQFKIRRRW